MSAEFEMAKAITKTYATGMDQGAKLYVPEMERALDLIRKARINPVSADALMVEAEAVLLDAVRRAKGLPF